MCMVKYGVRLSLRTTLNTMLYQGVWEIEFTEMCNLFICENPI